MRKTLVAVLGVFLLAIGAHAQDSSFFTLLGRYETGLFDEGAQEIGTYDAGSQRLFVTNADADSVDILDLSDPSMPTLITRVAFDEYGSGVNSVSAYEGVIAVAVEGAEVDTPGQIVFMDVDGNFLANFEAGVLPDMVTFSPDGQYVVSANEGEPSGDYSIDPDGSVTIIDLSGGLENAVVTQVGFTDFNADGVRAMELPEDVRIFGPNATVAQDLEPEYVAISGTQAFVMMQENNAIAVVDLPTAEIVRIFALGTKDYSQPENAIDASNEDGGINIQTWPVLSYYMADAIAAYEVDGVTYIVTANEGDARDYDTFSEEVRVGDEEVVLDPDVFPNAEELKQEANLGRLLITNTAGDIDGDGDYDVLYGYGARSFSIFTAEGELVFDSGSDFERITAERLPEAFNSNGQIDGFDGRSDDKGPEPEGVVLGVIDGITYAFIGLERIGGVMVYDITDPTMPVFVEYVNTGVIEGNAEEGTAGDVGPEGLIFIPAEDSPNGQSLLVITNEVSGSTTVLAINQ